MKTIIVGRYSQQEPALSAARELLRAGFPARETTLFYVNPQGQHDIFPGGGDEDESEGTHEASSGAVRGAVGGVGAGTLLGAATIPVLGPAGPLLGAAVGAYTGALVGALKHMEEADEHAEAARPAGEPAAEEPSRKAGVMLAVAITSPQQRNDAIDILGEHAEEVEEAEGVIQDGDWIDFNPLAPGKVIRQRTA